MAFTEVNGARLFYTSEGEGEPLVLIHGTGCDSFDWIYQMPALATKRRVVALDRRGHGHSSAPAGGYGPRAEAEDVIGIVDALGLQRFVAVGHSTGAGVAAALAANHPDRLKGIVLVDPSYGINAAARAAFERLGPALAGPDGHSVYRGMSDAGAYAPTAPAHLRPWHQRRIETVPVHVLSEGVIATALADDQFFFSPETEAFLKGVRCPALTIRRLREGLPTPSWDEARFSHPYSKSVGWENAGHFPHQERPDDFNRIVIGWVDGLPD